jgi:hypothetical protein
MSRVVIIPMSLLSSPTGSAPNVELAITRTLIEASD